MAEKQSNAANKEIQKGSTPSESDVEHAKVLIEYYKTQWNVINELDNLDWRIALIFIPLISAISFVFGIALQLNLTEQHLYMKAVQIFSLIAFVICQYGLWTVIKGQAHVTQKFTTLDRIEKDLGFQNYALRRPDKYKLKRFWPTVVCRRHLLFWVYLVLGVLSFSMIVAPTASWDLNTLFAPNVILIPAILAGTMISVQYYDHRLHMKSKCKCEKP